MNLALKAYLKMWDFVEAGDAKRIASQTPASGICENNDIPYINDGDEYHLLDIYYPQKTRKALPIIFDIHGGGWVYGTKKINKYYCMYMASLGYTVVNINYHLAPEAGIHETLTDIFAALNWTVANISDYYGNIDKLYVTGDSAGGQYAALVGAIATNDEFKSDAHFNIDPKLQIKALGLTSPACEFDSGLVVKFAGKLLAKCGNAPELSAKYRSASKLVTSKMPPCFIQEGQIDIVATSVKTLRRTLKKFSVESKYHNWKHEKSNQPLMHVFNVTNPEFTESEVATKEMLAFFDKH